MPNELDVDFDVVCCACGTGGTLAGIAAGLPEPTQRALGFAVLKGSRWADDQVRRLQAEQFGSGTSNWSIDHEFHFGGYAKRTAVLDEFIADFEARHDVTLDWVYEAKMMSGLFTRITEDGFPNGTTIIAVLN